MAFSSDIFARPYSPLRSFGFRVQAWLPVLFFTSLIFSSDPVCGQSNEIEKVKFRKSTSEETTRFLWSCMIQAFTTPCILPD